MGRKPNQVILQYFNRGSKLDDASNRYQHTCRACGEHFPKGRIEALITHLTKKCPSIDFQQKQDIVIQFYDISDSGHPGGLPAPKSCNRVEKSKPISLPFSPTKQNFNSLNILAEASRRVGANDPPKDGVYASLEGQHDPNLPLDPSLDIDSFTQTYLNDEDNLTANGMQQFVPKSWMLTGESAAVSTALSSSFNYIPPEPLIVSQGPELSSIAASANDILPIGPDLDVPRHTSENAMFNDAGSIGAPERQQGSDPIHEPQSEVASQLEKLNQSPLPVPIGAALRPLAMSKEAHFVSESGTLSKSPKPKVRGKFSPSRRQEVREMRQRGACLRCRMLKKTCSNGSPCQACGAIESPRIWKNPCIRTKLVNEFNLYFVGLHTIMTFRNIAQLKQNAVAQGDGGSLDIYHLDKSPTGVSLKATTIMPATPFAEVPGTHHVTAPQETPSAPCVIVGSDNDDISKKMGVYCRTTQDRLLEQDENPFMRTTIKVRSSFPK